MPRPSPLVLRTRRTQRLRQPTKAECLFARYFRMEKALKREFMLGSILIDFAMPWRNLLIEIDGSSHDHKKDKDARRDAWLQSFGFQVLRFTNDQLIDEPRTVKDEIEKHRRSFQAFQRFNSALSRVVRSMPAKVFRKEGSSIGVAAMTPW